MSDGYLRPGLIGDVRSAIAESMAKNGTEEKPETLSSLPEVKVENLLDKYSSLLNNETIAALNNPATAMIQLEDDETISQVRFLGKRTTYDNIDAAAKIICDNLNELAASGFIKGALSPLFKIDLHSLNQKDVELAVLSYVMLSAEGVVFFDETLFNVKVEEGGMPSEV